MNNHTSCEQSIWPQLSAASGGVSFLTSFVAQIPQLIETYRDKSVEGLSPVFLLCWLFGDITSLFGALLTHQLPFQIMFAIYYLANDIIICGQYYYYGILHENKLATPGHEAATVEQRLRMVKSRGSNPSILLKKNRRWWMFSFLFSRPSLADALPLVATAVSSTAASSPGSSPVGSVASWAGAMCYFCSRIPQLIKNYRRKSTDGLSPLLFICTLVANITYTFSIFTSCAYLTNADRYSFVINELPFIFGSSGTIIFDLIYFYQHYVLYADDQIIRQLESDEYTPLVAAASGHAISI